MTTIALFLGGTDQGRSGLGTYVREVLPRLQASASSHGDRLFAFGTPAELLAYDRALAGYARSPLPAFLDAPGPSALWHLLLADTHARSAGADVLLLPVANRRVALRGTLPTVAVVHDLAAVQVQGKYDALRTQYVRHAIVAGVRRSTVRVAISNATRDDLRTVLAEPNGPVAVIPNGVDVERFAPALRDDPRSHAARTELGLGRPWILYASRLEHPGKNHTTLLRAFARSRARTTHTLVLSGGDWGAKQRLEEEVRALHLEEQVRFTGHVSHELLTGLVVGAEAVAMVGLREGFGLPVLEALAAGVPVVAADAGALPEVSGPLGLLVPPFAIEAMAKALDRAVGDPLHRARVRSEGPAWARRWSWEHTAAELHRACLQAATQTRFAHAA